MLSRTSGNGSLFQAGSDQCVIMLFTCCNSSGSCLSNLRALQRKLVLFSLHFVDSDILLCIGRFFKPLEFCSLLRYFGDCSAF